MAKAAKNYYVELKNENGKFFWNLHERPTEQILEVFYFEEDARKLAKQLNGGRAFNGWTPSFFLRRGLTT